MNTSINLLEKLRIEINSLDVILISTLAKRMKVSTAIGVYKKEQNLPLLDKKRWKVVIQTRMKAGKLKGLDSRFIQELFDVIHKHSLLVQEKVKRA
ncbi:MAG: chorismate mutase [Nanoarchaeota archaeon]